MRACVRARACRAALRLTFFVVVYSWSALDAGPGVLVCSWSFFTCCSPFCGGGGGGGARCGAAGAPSSRLTYSDGLLPCEYSLLCDGEIAREGPYSDIWARMHWRGREGGGGASGARTEDEGGRAPDCAQGSRRVRCAAASAQVRRTMRLYDSDTAGCSESSTAEAEIAAASELKRTFVA